MTTWLDVAREYFPDNEEAELKYILFNCTCYPFGDEQQVREQLQELKEIDAQGINIYEYVDEKIERAMNESLNEGSNQISDGTTERYQPEPTGVD